MSAIHTKPAANPGIFEKLRVSLPWLIHYPSWRAREIVRRLTQPDVPRHLIIVVANHFEPSWNSRGINLDWDTQMVRLERWCRQAAQIGRAVQDNDGTPFRHTNFYPGEQYHSGLLNRLAELQADGLGEVEVHLHHGVEKPDSASNLRQALEDFRDMIAERHSLLSRMPGSDLPMYAFIHGNFALGNLDGGRNCGVNEELQILADTGCYADFTLPAFPYRSQVPRINAIYQCGRPLNERAPHWRGPDLAVNDSIRLPILLTGPLVFDWRRRRYGLPFPRVDDGALVASYPFDHGRLRLWRNAGISVRGRPEWIFVKLYCHGFFDHDQDAVIGEKMRRSLGDMAEWADRIGQFRVHFATAREVFNMVLAAVDGHSGDPHLFRDYRLRSIMQSKPLVSGKEAFAVQAFQE